MRLTIYYDGQFWIGVFEELYNAKLESPLKRNKCCKWSMKIEKKIMKI